jgi:hypothetical protein
VSPGDGCVGQRREPCVHCIPAWKARGWWCFRCCTELTAHDQRLGGRLLVVVEDGHVRGWHRSWAPIPFATVGQLLQFLVDRVLDHPADCLVFRIGTRVFLHAPTPAGRSTTILWNLQPAAGALIVKVRAVQPGYGGASIRIRLRPGRDADWRVEGPATFRPRNERFCPTRLVTPNFQGSWSCHGNVPLEVGEGSGGTSP